MRNRFRPAGRVLPARRTRRCLALLAGACAIAPLHVAAQAPRLELGFDSGVQVALPESGGRSTTFFVPAGWLRVGLPVAPRLQVEPVVSFGRSTVDGMSTTTVQAFPYLVYSHRGALTSGPYARVGVGVALVRFGGGGDSSAMHQFAMGAGIGVRLSVAEALALRLEAGGDRWFEDGDLEAYDLLQLLVGLSFFLR